MPPQIRRRQFLHNVASHSVLIAVSAMFLFPLLFVLMTSLMTDNQALTPNVVPDPFRFANYPDVFSAIPFFRYTFNTLTIAVLSTV